MNTIGQRLILISLFFAPGVWAVNAHLSHAIEQVLAAQGGYRMHSYTEASAHARAALGHIEILRRDHGADPSLRSAESDLIDSLGFETAGDHEKSARALDLAADRLNQFRAVAY